jgi:hypothetical protein
VFNPLSHTAGFLNRALLSFALVKNDQEGIMPGKGSPFFIYLVAMTVHPRHDR